MAAAESLKDVALRPWPATKKQDLSRQDLLEQIEQLTNERGHLRVITEKSLQEDLDAGKDVPDSAMGGLDREKEEKPAQSKDERLQHVFRTQQEMATHLEWARFAANNAVDLLSIILSSDPNKRSVNSFSHTFRNEGLSQGLPFGSFGISKENHDQHVRKQDEMQSLQDFQQRQELVAKGSRMEALDTATDDILKAAKQLEREVRRETKYWQEVVSISDKGWPIQRLRQNARNMPFGVRYGLPEASGHFKARGLAPLRMDKDGSIILYPALILKPKALRVRISENGVITGTSQLPVGDRTSEEQTSVKAIEKTIQQARDSLLEEELYHEMSLESRQLLAYGVEYRDSVIIVNAPSNSAQQKQTKLLIDCIPWDEHAVSDRDHSHDWLAQNVAEGLRLLLVHEHSMRLYRRSQAIPPLSGKSQENERPPLLRTLLAIVHHLVGVDSLYAYLETIANLLGSAGLDTSLTTERETAWAKLTATLNKSKQSGVSATDQLLIIFTKPLNGRATLGLPSSNGAQPEYIILSTRTVIGQPTFGTEYRVALPSNLASDLGLFQQTKVTSVDEVKSYLDWVLSLHIAQRQIKSDFANRATIKGNEPRITIQSKGSSKGSKSEHNIAVEMHEDGLKVVAISNDVQVSRDDLSRTHVWTGAEEQPTLKERIESWFD